MILSLSDRKPAAARNHLRPVVGLAVVLLGLATTGLQAQLPTVGTVVAGSATITTAPNTMTVTAGNNSVLRWGSFDVGTGQTVQFVQPGSDARVLNWIGGLTPSQIDGSLLANGQVYLLNPAGVYIGQSAVIDVGRLYAIGGSMAKEDFLSGIDRFTGLTGDVRNAGSIRGDFIALVGRSVANSGSIVSPGGFIGLASGDQVLLGRNGSSIYVDTGRSASADAALRAGTGVANTGTIDAGRGSTVLAAGDLYSIAISHDGKLVARDVRLQGQGRGDVLVSGTIDASATAPGETGGRVEITGEHVGLLNTANINASGDAGGGTVLVGGDYQGKNPDVRNATATYFGPGASVNADALNSGNGGKVIVWSDNATRAYGTLSARGGEQGGNGGLVETSGHWLDVAGVHVDTSASLGTRGTWLLDPYNVTIAAGAIGASTFGAG
ncbi:MAG TPA: filamentous hemagglutinin N-terminal domain-containing protein, partial [Lacunisphaera sp.]|nr:filamentous hemagglutinin N-terminal domain-containing protein [Lacunisphaera sp.]